MNLVYALLQWTLMLVVRILLILIGFGVVAIALPFRIEAFSAKYPDRKILNLPRWAWLFGNDFDGLLGDRRGWWDENADSEVFFGLLPWIRRIWPALPVLTAEHPLSMWWWAAVRNPVNNLRHVPGFLCPVEECDITYIGDEYVVDKPDHSGWQFVMARRRGGRSRWFGFYYVRTYSRTRAFVIRLGFKIEPRHAGTSEAKGMTFKINPYKEI